MGYIRRERTIGAFIAVAGVALGVATAFVRLGLISDPVGERGVGYGASALLLLCGVSIALHSPQGRSREPEERNHEQSDSLNWRKAALILAGCAGWVTLLPLAGFLAASTVFMATSTLALGARLNLMIVASTTAPVVAFLLFGSALGVRFPQGPIDAWIASLMLRIFS